MKRNKLSILDEQNYEYAVRALNDQKVRCSEEFEYWLSVDSNRALFQELSETKEALILLEPEMAPDTEKAWRTLRSRISVRRRAGIFYWGVSAAAAFLLLIGYFLWMKEKEVVVFTTVSQSGEVMLRVGENESVSIDALTQEAHLSAELGATLNAGTLAYSQESQQSSVKMHTLATPRGRTFHLALSDGTEIWLNGETTLHYPSRFTGGERRVELVEGEAFFQVAPDTSLPFVVKNKTTKTQVLGTVFNVRAYPGENRSVTLLTGSVEVSDTFKANKVKLAPGENVYLDAAYSRLVAQPADVSEMTAWRENLFCFRETTLEHIMKAIGRWYNLTIVFKSQTAMHYRFNFWANRNETPEHVLRILNLTGKVKVRQDGGTIVIEE